MIKKTFKRLVVVLVVLAVVIPLGSSFVSPPVASASGWAGWSSISKIYFNTSQDDATNHFLQNAALELQTYLGQMAGRSFTITNSYPPAPAIYLSVNATVLAGHGEEASRLVLDNDGVTITGKTAFAARSGCYRFLDMLGVKWLGKGSIWTIVPSSLSDPGAIDQIEEPDYIWREIDFGPNPLYGESEGYIWRIRNLCGGPTVIRVGHSYNQFMPASEYLTHPDSFLVDITSLSENLNDSATTIYVVSASGFPSVSGDTPVPLLRIDNETIAYTTRSTETNTFSGCTRGYNGTTPASHTSSTAVYQQPANDSYNKWQLKPDDATVINHATTFAEDLIAEGDIFNIYTGEDIPRKVVSISPNDGQDWGSYSSKTNQEITDLVYGLLDDVAAPFYATNPDWLFGAYNYSLYSDLPTANFTNPNIYVEVATAYDYTEFTTAERIAGLTARGANVGIREYYDIFQWYQDVPPYWGKIVLNRIKTFQGYGANVYRSEGCNSWGACGIIFWMAARLTWDSSQSIDDLIDEYCTYAFGAAKTPMIRFYQRMIEGQHLTENYFAGAVTDLDEAVTLAGSDEDILARIRSMIYYTYWMNKYKTVYLGIIDELDTEAFTELYTWVSHLRDLYILPYQFYEEDIFHDPLRDDWGWDEETIQTWLTENADYTIPTSANATTWLAEMVAEYSEVTPVSLTHYIEPMDLTLEALGDTITPPYSNPDIGVGNVIIKASSNVTISFDKSNYDAKEAIFYTPDEDIIEVFTIPQGTGTISHEFEVTTEGLYILVTNTAFTITSGQAAAFRSLDVEDSDTQLGACDLYFYVPVGTQGFLIEFSGETDPSAIYDPNGDLFDSFGERTTDYVTMGANNPATGLWRIHYGANSWKSATFQLFGIPDLLWYNPQNYMIVGDTTPTPPRLNPVGNKTAYVNSLLQFKVSATDPNGGVLTYSASNLPTWATFNPATRTFSGTPIQTGTYTDIYFEVSDGVLTDGEYITITVNLPGGRPDVNRDGIVNILDMINVSQHLGESGSNGWIAQDANSDGRIDVLDVIVIGQHWVP